MHIDNAHSMHIREQAQQWSMSRGSHESHQKPSSNREGSVYYAATQPHIAAPPHSPDRGES